MAALTAQGAGLAALARGLRAGHCPVRRAEGLGFPGEPPLVSALPPRDLPSGDAAAALLLREAVDQLAQTWGGEVATLRDDDTALIVGSGGFLYASGAELYRRTQFPHEATTPFRVRGPAWGTVVIAEHLQLRGPTLTLSTGCSSSANAFLAAMEMLRRGRARRVIVLGAEGLSATTLSGFDSLMLLPPEGCKPFDKNRAGLQIGEGIAALLLEADDGADNTHNVLTLRGGANLCDTHHLTSASPDGRVMREVMQRALDQAHVAPGDIVAIKAHGTGSVDSDQAEANAIHALFGEPPPVVGLKRYIGHTLGACGAIETVALGACLRAGFVPATAGFETPDPEVNLVPTRAALVARRGLYLLNFFGFGGNYTSLVLGFEP